MKVGEIFWHRKGFIVLKATFVPVHPQLSLAAPQQRRFPPLQQRRLPQLQHRYLQPHAVNDGGFFMQEQGKGQRKRAKKIRRERMAESFLFRAFKCDCSLVKGKCAQRAGRGIFVGGRFSSGALWRLMIGIGFCTSGGTCSSPSTVVTGRKQELRRPHVHIVVAWCASMAISRTLKSLKALTTGSRLSSGLYHVSATTPFSARSPFPLLFPSDLQLRLTSAHPRLFSPFCRLIPCSVGPLFLSSPPWQLSQNATPLYLHGDLIRGSGISLGLVHGRCLPAGFPIKEKQHLDNREASHADSVFNLPNSISFGRMASGPFLGWMIVNEYYSLAFLGLAMSGATDWLDGYVARRMNVNSVIGSYLDPLADKVLIGCVAVSMMKMNLLHPTLVGLVVLRDIALVGGAIYKRVCSMHWEWQGWYDFINLDANTPEKVKPTLLSKVNTVLQLTLVAAALLQPEFGSDKTEVCILGLR